MSRSIRRWWRASSLNGVSRNSSTKRVASSSVCIRPPTEITFALLCCRPSVAVCSLQASAQRTPSTLLAAIASPLPEPPMTMPNDPGSATTASAAGRQ